MSTDLPTLLPLGPLDLRIATVTDCCVHPDARKPALILTLDVGDLGTLISSAQITDHYTPADLIGTQVIIAANLPPRRIGSIVSQALVLGVPDRSGSIVLLRPASSKGGQGASDIDPGTPIS